MVPYVVCQGDYLDEIAWRRGVTPESIWNDPLNSDLKKRRPNSNVLLTGDILWVPEPPDPKWLAVSVGGANKFVAKLPVVTVSAVLNGPDGSPLAGRAFRVLAGDATAPQPKTDGDGRLQLLVRMPCHEVTLSVDGSGDDGGETRWRLHVGHLDPHNEPSGARQRLTHLGIVGRIGLSRTYFVGDDGPREDDDPALTSALAEFQRGQGIPVTGELDPATADALKTGHGV